MAKWIISGCLFAECAGYFLHRLLHSDRVRFLSRNHMIHHLLLYNPKNLRSDHYKDPTVGEHARIGIWGFGLEWLAPVGIWVTGLVAVFSLLHISWQQQFFFVVSALLWSYLLFGVIHNAMHLNHPRLMRIVAVRRWFLRARRFHDIHHVQINERGLMNKNFGICFFFMDRIFGTLEKQAKPFEESAYRRALNRYSFITR
jgi:sterol desaturase/sphingolipid hydroxylase (fatty acid hydroxylase superfamily)